MMAGRLLVPVTGAIGVYDPVSGTGERYIPVDRAANPRHPGGRWSRPCRGRGC